MDLQVIRKEAFIIQICLHLSYGKFTSKKWANLMKIILKIFIGKLVFLN